MAISRPLSSQPIPPHANSVFKGQMFEVFQWPQVLFDGTSATFEKVKGTDTVSILPIVDGKILITEQQQPARETFFGVVGGRIDANETPLEAAQRELLEETGYRANHWQLWYSTQLLSQLDWAIYTFLAKECVKITEPKLEGGEEIKLLYLSFEEYLELIRDERYRDLELALKLLRATPKQLQAVKKRLLG